MSSMPAAVANAFAHIRQSHPEIVMCVINRQGQWLFMDADFDAPEFEDPDVELLEDMIASLDNCDVQFPVVYELSELERVKSSMQNLKACIEAAVAEKLESVEIVCASEINDGLSADFAHYIVDTCKVGRVLEICDESDSAEFGRDAEYAMRYLRDGFFRHTCIVFENRFFDAECPGGVTRLLALPIFKRVATLHREYSFGLY